MPAAPGKTLTVLSRGSARHLLLLVIVLLILDQVTKLVVRRWLDPHELIQILPFFRFEHVQNNGIAFGMLDGHSFLITLVDAVIVLALVAAAVMVRDNSRLALPMALLVAGSVGNLIDRIINGNVTDFLHFKYWPAFNLADSFIVIGVALLAVRLILTPNTDSPQTDS